MDPIQQLLEWATSRGVALHGIGPKPLPGRGIGIVAVHDLKAGEDILTVPDSMSLSLEKIPASLVRNLHGATVHAILSAAICADTSPDFALWRAVFPSRQDVAAGMPICWPPELQDLLPVTSKALLAKQKAKFEADWQLVTPAQPGLLKADFLYAWLLVSSRSFYHKTAMTARRPSYDHMVLQPVADLFNHSPQGCTATFEDGVFTVTTTQDLVAGDEIFLCYGSHANDLLLAEYGFTLPLSLNPWDETCLDPYLCPRFSADQRQELENVGFWGGYMLDSDTACYRTQIALRVLSLPPGQWREVLDGQRDENDGQDYVDAQLLKVLRTYEKDIKRKMMEIDRVKFGQEAMRAGLRERWTQIRELIVMTMARIEG